MVVKRDCIVRRYDSYLDFQNIRGERYCIIEESGRWVLFDFETLGTTELRVKVDKMTGLEDFIPALRDAGYYVRVED